MPIYILSYRRSVFIGNRLAIPPIKIPDRSTTYNKTTIHPRTSVDLRFLGVLKFNCGIPSFISRSSGPRSRNFVATPPNGGTAAMDDFPGWDDGGEYARAAEAAGVDVGGMLEAGVDAKQLLEFVSNYRRQEGETNVRIAGSSAQSGIGSAS